MLQMWADVSGITFSDQGNTDNATILFGNYNDPHDDSGGFAYRPKTNDQSFVGREGDVFVNLASRETTVTAGDKTWKTLIHEIGHALGLQHPGDYNATEDMAPTYAADALYVQDTRQYTVMSYFGERHTDGDFSVFNETPMLHDIAAIQRLYGAVSPRDSVRQSGTPRAAKTSIVLVLLSF